MENAYMGRTEQFTEVKFDKQQVEGSIVLGKITDANENSFCNCDLKQMDTRPILYSFRRCPYAIRARLAIYSADIQVELREILLREKAPKFLEASESKTVPCLQTKDTILDESLDIMIWALSINDPENWLEESEKSLDFITTCDGPFKKALDRTKYPNRYQRKTTRKPHAR